MVAEGDPLQGRVSQRHFERVRSETQPETVRRSDAASAAIRGIGLTDETLFRDLLVFSTGPKECTRCRAQRNVEVHEKHSPASKK